MDGLIPLPGFIRPMRPIRRRPAVALAADEAAEREGFDDMGWRGHEPIGLPATAGIALISLFGYSAWLTSIVFCAANGMHPLVIADAAFFPVGVVHGVGVWFGGW